jgi:hypothetical protein
MGVRYWPVIQGHPHVIHPVVSPRSSMHRASRDGRLCGRAAKSPVGWAKSSVPSYGGQVLARNPGSSTCDPSRGFTTVQYAPGVARWWVGRQGSNRDLQDGQSAACPAMGNVQDPDSQKPNYMCWPTSLRLENQAESWKTCHRQHFKKLPMTGFHPGLVENLYDSCRIPSSRMIDRIDTRGKGEPLYRFANPT